MCLTDMAKEGQSSCFVECIVLLDIWMHQECLSCILNLPFLARNTAANSDFPWIMTLQMHLRQHKVWQSHVRVHKRSIDRNYSWQHCTGRQTPPPRPAQGRPAQESRAKDSLDASKLQEKSIRCFNTGKQNLRCANSHGKGIETVLPNDYFCVMFRVKCFSLVRASKHCWDYSSPVCTPLSKAP